MDNNSVTKTIIVAFSLCVVCSVLVSSAAVSLKPLQIENQKFDIKKNLLLASGLLDSPRVTRDEIMEAYSAVQAKVIDFKTGEVVDIRPEDFDERRASRDPNTRYQIPRHADVGNLRFRAPYGLVYTVEQDGEVAMIVLPVYGRGLWSTMYGFLALAPDTRTVKGLGFYEHGETPGLGGEIENPRWLASWGGKKALGEDYTPALEVIKGAVGAGTPNPEYKIDGLSGATITANGVTGMIQYWLSDDAYGVFLREFRERQIDYTHHHEDEDSEEGYL
jgi:Na+-transporting NADH:ubiquinone oxidoreductase subunit C